ncbi:MAG: polysaccharide deacetylase family protein [Chitinophagales bacterium]|nr:polysaccharide deacetylase family protein [Chitinophagales bacterium]
MYLINIPKWQRWFFPGAIFSKKEENIVYLTFDDGPNTGITDDVLTILESYNAKATFFCLGKNAEKMPDLLCKIVENGHAIGNHGYEHINGWRTIDKTYIENVEKGKSILQSNLFRPPYGKITVSQFLKLRKDNSIIFWDIMPGDFDDTITNEKCLKNALSQLKSGSIMVLHDSEKAANKLRYILPKILDYLKSSGLKTGVLG